MQVLASLVCGLIFGIGLVTWGMTQPAKVLGFLDVLGRWDPTLAFVLAGALTVSTAGYAMARRDDRPVLGERHLWPTRTDIDRPLLAGATLFGIGWGLVGLCPGPALVNLATLSPKVVLFVLAMIGGMALQGWWPSRAPAATAGEETALASSDG